MVKSFSFDRSRRSPQSWAKEGSHLNFQRWCEILATVGYVGRARYAPGTMGTLVGIPLALGLMKLGPLLYMALAFALVLASIAIAEVHEQHLKTHDASEIVIDEVVGYVITLTWLPLTWQTFALGFVLFRFLDVLKPFPINVIDRKVKGGFGVVLDDVAAGIIANVVLQVIYTRTGWLGWQLIQ